ncbi:F-box protein family-like [Rhynchospora pubera]|uniref:F-box protein family-like n=1 Tax=Rhynchospora pubera TaxID=906938 RepID=A0AAV8BPW0_9POAL|nr:F-box protein family-like [Rhynchospora pubera]
MGCSTSIHKEEKNKERCKIDNSRTWTDMPIELMQLLVPRLCLVDCVRLASLCKAWNSLSNLIQDAMVNPWLIYCENESSTWKIFDPVCGKEYSIDMKWLGFSENLTFLYSKDGWVLASKEDNSLFLINSLRRECVISLPKLNTCCRFKPLAFSSAPTSPDCVVVIAEFEGEHIAEVSTWSPGEEQWSTTSFQDEIGYNVLCNPVFTRGEFYWYSNGGELLVFNPFQKTWKVLEIETPTKMASYYRRLVMECYLVKSGADLITVFRGLKTEPMQIFKLDRLNMVWSELHDIGDVSIFLDCRATIAKSFPEKWCRNRIYLCGFSDNHIERSAFYSLETAQYHPKYPRNFKEPMVYIWIEPNLTS